MFGLSRTRDREVNVCGAKIAAEKIPDPKTTHSLSPGGNFFFSSVEPRRPVCIPCFLHIKLGDPNPPEQIWPRTNLRGPRPKTRFAPKRVSRRSIYVRRFRRARTSRPARYAREAYPGTNEQKNSHFHAFPEIGPAPLALLVLWPRFPRSRTRGGETRNHGRTARPSFPV